MRISEIITTLDAWLAFVRAHGEPCFTEWTDARVRQWLGFHARNRSLIVIEQNGETLALAVGWQCRESELEQPWESNDPDGDCFYIAHCIATNPVALGAVIAQFNEQWPHWRNLRLFWRRAGKGLREMPERSIEKLYAACQRRSKGVFAC